MLKFIVVPLVLFSIMAGILSMNDVSKVGKLGLRALIYFMFTTVIAVTLGLTLSTLVKGFLPHIHVETASSAHEIEIPDITIMSQIVNMFPDNIMAPLSNMTMIQVIVIAVFFGVAMVFASAQIPVECVAFVAGVDRIVDMGRTVMSITGDASCAVVMNNIFKGQETTTSPNSGNGMVTT